MKLNDCKKWFSPEPHGGLLLVLLASGALGFFLGCFAVPEWQVAVETAQVVAGLVQYPADNPFYLYHVKLWTILHQVLAPLLKLGMSEQTASLLVSGLLGMVSLQAFATVILALSGDWILAVGGAAVVYFARPNEFGVNYPVWFMGAEHTYGILGLSYMLLVIALLGGGWRRSGAFLLGLAPAVHPSLGFWLGVMVAACCLLDLRQFRENWLPWLKFFFLGGAVTTVSLILQIALVYDVPKGPPVDAARYFVGFVSFWDMHRAPVFSGHPGVLFNWWLLGFGLAWLIFFRRALPPGAVLIVQAITVTAALGLGAMALSWIHPEKLPRTLVMLMPSRLLNFPILASLPFLIGLLGVYRQKVWAQVLLFVFLAGLLFAGAIQDGVLLFFSSNIWHLLVAKNLNPEFFAKLMVHPWKWMAAISLALLVAAALQRWAPARKAAPAATPATRKNKTTAPTNPSAGGPGAAWPWLRGANCGLLGLYLVLTLLTAVVFAQTRKRPFKDWTNDPVWAAAAKGQGLLATGADLHLIQLKTRRAILLDGGGLDGIAYVLQAAPAMERILKDVYKIDLFHPPEEARGQGAIPRWTGQPIWESFPLEHWMELSKRYGFVDVLTYSDWNLNLPKVIGNEELTLYRIPVGDK